MHVLIVENDEQLGRDAEVAIRRWGDTSAWVRDGLAAVAAAKSIPFDLVLLDLGLPRLGGIDVPMGPKRDSTPVPVIVIGARDALDDRVQGLDLGADDCLVKPSGEDLRIEGVGLGLPIANRIADLHRATLRLTNARSGGGLRVEVRFPVTPHLSTSIGISHA